MAARRAGGPRARSSIVLQQPNQSAPTSDQTQEKQAHAGKVRGIYSPPLKLQSDLWVPLI